MSFCFFGAFGKRKASSLLRRWRMLGFFLKNQACWLKFCFLQWFFSFVEKHRKGPQPEAEGKNNPNLPQKAVGERPKGHLKSPKKLAKPDSRGFLLGTVLA